MNLGLSVVLFVAVVMLYLDGRGSRAAIAALERQTAADREQIATLARSVAGLSQTAGSSPPTRTAVEGPAQREDVEPLTPHATRPGDDCRRTSSRPPPPVQVVRATPAPPRGGEGGGPPKR